MVVFLLAVSSAGGCASEQVRPLRDDRLVGREPVVVRKVTGDYEQVWEDLNSAIIDQGLVVSSVSHVGEMLDRTGQSLDNAKKIFDRARVLEFCSAILSRAMMETNPHFIAFCPYQIKVYSLSDQEGTVYLAYRRLTWNNDQGREVLDPVEHLLDSLVTEVVEMQEQFR
jgi:uncharacterized protein (DUF302 family)